MIEPYKLTPIPSPLGVLVDSERYLDEAGDTLPLTSVPPGLQVWADHELIWQLLVEGRGEALCWNGQPIRWRPIRNGQSWGTSAASDVRVLKLAFPSDLDTALDGLLGWRTWLAEHGAAPQGSLGSSAWSLLRATLDQTLWTSVGNVPPIRYTIGGRQELGPAGISSFRCSLRLWDMPAAYAHTLGTCLYGGRWVRSDPQRVSWEEVAQQGAPLFVRCTVQIPEGIVGPLPLRPRRQLDGWDWLLAPIHYPPGPRKVQGCWTYWELAAAQEAGCRVREVTDVFVHLSSMQPFARWWRAVQEGRAIGGFAGSLAKGSGNALWGQFCIGRGQRTVQAWEKGRRKLQRLAPLHGRPRAPDLAEWITGKVRAELYTFMQAAGPQLVSAHTDGGWVASASFRQPGWRSKEAARELRVLNPQCLAYRRPGEDETRYVVAGWPPSLAEAKFEEQWAKEVA